MHEAAVLGTVDTTAVVVAMIGAVSSICSGWFAYLASRRAKHSRQASEQAVRAIGPRDGETISALLWRIAEFEEYQHDRNHDILNVLQRVILQNDLVMRALGISPRRVRLPPRIKRKLPRFPPPGDDEAGS